MTPYVGHYLFEKESGKMPKNLRVMVSLVVMKIVLNKGQIGVCVYFGNNGALDFL